MGELAYGGSGPRTAVVVGAGVVGLSTAWFLQERGIEVTVLDRRDVAAGASWGNAGWLSPGLAIPLNEPSVLRHGLRALLDRRAPLYVPATVDPALWRFLLRFAAHSTWREWNVAARAGALLNADCFEAFDVLVANGVRANPVEAPFVAAFESARQASGLLAELRRLTQAGQEIDYTAISGCHARELRPQLSQRVGAGVRLDGQRYVDPGEFVAALAESVRARGGTVRGGFEVVEVRPHRHAATVRAAHGELVSGNVVVWATGAWSGRLARRWGVRVPVRAGRGYSFTVATEEPVSGPLYLPEARVACTPYRGGLRVAGTMEFRPPEAKLDTARIDAIVASARPFLRGVRWDERTDEWVGPRPVTPDGRPLIGAVRAPGVYLACGHGMWGLTQGPVTGRLLAEQISTGKRPEALRACDPLR